MTGATGNVYTGLHEFADMAFVLHLLRPDDVFVDVGANIGSYTILAAAVAGARSIAFEPIPAAFEALRDNVQLNRVVDRVCLHRSAVGRTSGTVRMTTECDTGNRVVHDAEPGAHTQDTMDVAVIALDELEDAIDASVLKIDVEGFESEVLAGAKHLLARPSLLAVVMETNRAARAHDRSETEAHRMLLASGFDSYTYAPFERRLVPLDGAYKDDANTLYLRDAARVSARLQGAAHFDVLGQQV